MFLFLKSSSKSLFVGNAIFMLRKQHTTIRCILKFSKSQYLFHDLKKEVKNTNFTNVHCSLAWVDPPLYTNTKLYLSNHNSSKQIKTWQTAWTVYELCKEQFGKRGHFLIQQFYKLKIIPFLIESNLQYQMAIKP